MITKEVEPFVGKTVRVTLADTRVLAGTLRTDRRYGRYTITSDTIEKGGEPIRETIQSAAQITDIEDASTDPAAVE